MTDDERKAIEHELELETRFVQRQQLMKRLWRLSSNRPYKKSMTIRNDKPAQLSQDTELGKARPLD